MSAYKQTLPNFLTLLRIIIIPLLVGCFYLEAPLSGYLGAALFFIAGITDYFDGKLARNWNSVSPLGTFLDPIADKLLVASVLIMLIHTRQIDGPEVWAAIIILCREILISGLREFLGKKEISMPVTRLAKWKTGSQMLALFLLILDIDPTATLAGGICLWIAAMLTVITGYGYIKAGLKHL